MRGGRWTRTTYLRGARPLAVSYRRWSGARNAACYQAWVASGIRSRLCARTQDLEKVGPRHKQLEAVVWVVGNKADIRRKENIWSILEGKSQIRANDRRRNHD